MKQNQAAIEKSATAIAFVGFESEPNHERG